MIYLFVFFPKLLNFNKGGTKLRTLNLQMALSYLYKARQFRVPPRLFAFHAERLKGQHIPTREAFELDYYIHYTILQIW